MLLMLCVLRRALATSSSHTLLMFSMPAAGLFFPIMSLMQSTQLMQAQRLMLQLGSPRHS